MSFLIRLKEFYYNIINIPKASVVLLSNGDKILAVSRKNDPNDFGLVGGKVDKGETFRQAAIRETLEETNFDIFNLKPIFTRRDGDFMAIVYTADYIELPTNYKSGKETGVVKWVSFEEIKKGSFGVFNTELEKKLNKK